MLEVPKRLSLTTQAAQAIRKGVEEGLWEEYLPGERRLCEMIQVSRPTVRAALHLLAREGLLEIHQGRRNRICPATRAAAPAPKRMVGLILKESMEHVPARAYQTISELRTHLAEQGFSTEVLVCQPRGAHAQRRKVEAFLKQNRVLCCVLLSVSQTLQQWFVDHDVPALVLGSCHPSVPLPSLDVDYRAVCRHAVGVYLRKGHRNLALVIPDSAVAGDLASEEGFREGLAQTASAETRGVIVRHQGSARALTAKLDILFRSSQPPTALLVAKPLNVLAVLMYLLKRGMSVPDTVSLIARDQDPAFAIVHPAIAHYAFKDQTYARLLSHLISRLLEQGYLPAQSNLVFPDFFSGETVKALS